MTITIQKESLRLDTATYTLTDIQNEIEEDIQILCSLGYTSISDKRIKAKFMHRARQLGVTSKKSAYTYEIGINEEYLRVADPKEVHNTIMHECIHCVDGCMNHGEKWKTIAAKVNARFDFTPITRTGNDENYDSYMHANKCKYRLSCDKCGAEWYYMRRGKVLDECKQGKRRCSCGGREFTVTELRKE